MFEVISIFLILSFSGYIFKDKIKEKYDSFRSLNKLMSTSTKYKNICSIVYLSCKMIAKVYWLYFLQWCNNSIEKTKSGYILSYAVGGNIYRIFLKHKRGPKPFLIVVDENDNDVTDEILQFLGPNQDWHGQKYCPENWNKKCLTFEMSDGEQKIFENQNFINF